jgi:hypothetical protein
MHETLGSMSTAKREEREGRRGEGRGRKDKEKN